MQRERERMRERDSEMRRGNAIHNLTNPPSDMTTQITTH